MERLSSPAAEALRHTVRSGLTTLFGSFLRQLPEALLRRGEPSMQIPNERRAREDLAHSVSVDAPRWVDTFVTQVDIHLIGTVGAQVPAADPVSEASDSIALANIELRAEALHQALIWEFDAKLDHVRRSLYVPVFARAVAPAGLCRALQDTAIALGCTDTQRRVLFEQFDERLVGELQHFYRSLIDAIADIRARALAPVPGTPPIPGQPAPVETPPPIAAPVAPAAPRSHTPGHPRVDDKTEAMLRDYAAQASPDGYNDGTLAHDLLALNRDESIGGIEPGRNWVPLQRIELAGQFLNDAISDPLVSDDLRPHHEAVRFPLVKSALTDATLFTAVTHPLRSLVNDLMLKSATSRITGSVEARQMADVLRQVLVQFDLAPDFVREAMLNAQPIQDEQIHKFFEIQRQQAKQRREAIVAEAKRQVVRKLELATFGRSLPAQAIKFLNTIWGPLMVKRLLQYGVEHAQWKAALALMDKMLDQLDGLEPGQPPSPVWITLMRTMGTELMTAGMPQERVSAAVAALEAAWKSGSQHLQPDEL
jgi:hypothetical protein